MTVQARFYVKSITNHHNAGSPGSVQAEIKLAAAFGSYLKGLPENNTDWSKYTPQGEISMMVTNPAAIEQFELGEVYAITFEKIERD